MKTAKEIQHHLFLIFKFSTSLDTQKTSKEETIINNSNFEPTKPINQLSIILVVFSINPTNINITKNPKI